MVERKATSGGKPGKAVGHKSGRTIYRDAKDGRVVGRLERVATKGDVKAAARKVMLKGGAQVTVRKIGGSDMCTIPKSIQQEWGEVRPRTKLLARVEGRRLILERIAKPRLTLKERIAMCNLDAPMSAAEREWMDDGPVGEELL